jgi:hypothetical protein
MVAIALLRQFMFGENSLNRQQRCEILESIFIHEDRNKSIPMLAPTVQYTFRKGLPPPMASFIGKIYFIVVTNFIVKFSL